MQKTIFNHKITIDKVSDIDTANALEVHPLSPMKNLDEGDNQERYIEYENRLISALKHDDIFNIAITGTYGSGKSSVLSTFKRRFKDTNQWRFLDISLSTFQVNEKDENAKSTKTTLTDEQIQLIERSILQQFFYAVPQDKIPFSRFKRIAPDSKIIQFISVATLILFIVSGLVVFNKVDFIELIYPTLPLWLPKASLWVFCICFLIIVYRVLSTTYELSEIKLNFHDSEFNIKSDKEKSILNDHLDEILYFFDATKKNVVIIEDLDRFDNNEIFIRLRELNAIINKYRSQKVVFIYAIKDDMFKDKERTKFFEYILPVIPVINPSNAFNWIQSNYEEVASKLDRKFLRNICIYFDDLRLVKNIFNEYELYSKNLKELNLDRTMLFSIIVYKNRYPNDFSELHSNHGEVYKVFNSYKQNLISEHTKDLKNRLDEIDADIVNLEAENINNIEELNSIYSGALISYISEEINEEYKRDLTFTVQSGDNEFKIHEVNSTTFFESTMEEGALKYKFHNPNFHSRQENKPINFKEIEKRVDTNHTYEQRLKKITDKIEGKVKKLHKEKIDILKKIKTIKLKKISDFRDNDDLLEKKPILRFLIINGYIDESYAKYISYFSDSDITLDEQNYLIQVSEQREPIFDIKIKNPKVILEEYIDSERLILQSSLNFQILDYLLTHQDFTYHLNALLENICNGTYESFEFTSQYLQRRKNLHLFIPLVLATKETTIDDLEIGFDNEDSYYNLTQIINHLPLEQLAESDYLTRRLKEILEDYSSYIKYILDCFSGEEDEFKKFTDIIKPKITRLEYTPNHSKIINWLGSNDYLTVSIKLLGDVINSLYPVIDKIVNEELLQELQKKPFTLLSKLTDSYLPSHLWSNNLTVYVDVFLDNLIEGEYFEESEDIYIQLLNSEYISPNQSDELMKAISTKITDITEVNSDLHGKLFEYNVARANWDNIVTYFKENEDTLVDVLIKFINLNSDSLAQKYQHFKNSAENDIEPVRSIELALIKCNELEDIAYKNILGSSDSTWLNIDISNLNESKVLFLISNSLFGLNSTNWQSIVSRENGEMRNLYIEHYISSIMDGDLLEELEATDFKTILLSKLIDKERKQDFIEKNIDRVINILDTSIKYIIDIFGDKPLPGELYNHIQNSSESENIRYLFLKQKDNLSNNDILKLLPLMGAPFNELNYDDNNKTKFNVSIENKELLKALQTRGIIISFGEDKVKKLGYYETRLDKRLNN